MFHGLKCQKRIHANRKVGVCNSAKYSNYTKERKCCNAIDRLWEQLSKFSSFNMIFIGRFQ